MRPAHLLVVLEKEFKGAAAGNHTPVMLWGAPGVVKSEMVSQVAKKIMSKSSILGCRKWSQVICVASLFAIMVP